MPLERPGPLTISPTPPIAIAIAAHVRRGTGSPSSDASNAARIGDERLHERARSRRTRD